MSRIGSEKTSVLSSRVWEIFGFGSQYAWLFSVTYGSAIYGGGAQESWAWAARLAVVVGTFLAYLVFSRTRRKRPEDPFGRGSVLAYGAVGLVGTSAMYVLARAEVETHVRICLIAAAGLACGLTSAAMMLGGNALWSRLRPERVILHITVSAVASCVLVGALYLLPPAASAAVVPILPALGGVILVNTRLGRQPAAAAWGSVVPLPRNTMGKTLVHVGVSALVLGVVLGTVAARDVVRWGSMSVPAMAFVLVAMVVVMAVSIRCDATLTLRVLSQASFPLMLLGTVALAALPDGASAGCWAAVLAGFVMTDLFMWFVNYQLVVRSGMTSLGVLARSAAVEWAFLAAGMAIGRVLWVASPASGGELSTWAYMGCAALLVAEQTLGLTPIETARLISDRKDAFGVDVLDAACARVSQRNGLSDRESQVLSLLARGRSIPYICDELGVSQSTVKTHVRSIYRKCAVGGRQELLDLVDAKTPQ